MGKYIVVDDQKNEHIVEAGNPGYAMGQIAGAESCRIAQQVEIERIENQKPKIRKIQARR